MFAALLLGFDSLTFTSAQFDGLTVPVPCPAAAPLVDGRTKIWKGEVDAPLSARYKAPTGPWTNPYYRVRITDLIPHKGKIDEESAVQDRIERFGPKYDLVQVVQRITMAKLGSHTLAVFNGGAFHVARRGLIPVYFVECCFAIDKKLFEYTFASTHTKDVEQALESLKDLSFSASGKQLTGEALPIGVQGKYSVGSPIVVETPIVPLPQPYKQVMEGQQWQGVIGNPDDGGYVVRFSEIRQQNPLGSRVFARDDEQLARHMLCLFQPSAEDSFKDVPTLVEKYTLEVRDLQSLMGTKAGLRIATRVGESDVVSGQYLRSSQWSGILVCHGDKKLGDGEVRLTAVSVGDVLAPRRKGG